MSVPSAENNFSTIAVAVSSGLTQVKHPLVQPRQERLCIDRHYKVTLNRIINPIKLYCVYGRHQRHVPCASHNWDRLQ